jgi:hypothetical protein
MPGPCWAEVAAQARPDSRAGPARGTDPSVPGRCRAGGLFSGRAFSGRSRAAPSCLAHLAICTLNYYYSSTIRRR